MCGSSFHAVNDAHTKYSASYAVTGVGCVDCAHHGFKRPTGVVDLQKGERCVAPFHNCSINTHILLGTLIWTLRCSLRFSLLSVQALRVFSSLMTSAASGRRISTNVSPSMRYHCLSGCHPFHTGVSLFLNFTSPVTERIASYSSISTSRRVLAT